MLLLLLQWLEGLSDSSPTERRVHRCVVHAPPASWRYHGAGRVRLRPAGAEGRRAHVRAVCVVETAQLHYDETRISPPVAFPHSYRKVCIKPKSVLKSMRTLLGLGLLSIGFLCADAGSEPPFSGSGIDSSASRTGPPAPAACVSGANRRRCRPGMCVRVAAGELCLGCAPGLLLVDGACVGRGSPEAALAGCETAPGSSACLSCSGPGYRVRGGGCFGASAEVLELVERLESASAPTCDEDPFSSQFSSIPGKCKTRHCVVDLGGSKYCSRCSVKSERLVDGKCLSSGGDDACTLRDPPDGTCKSCGAGYLLYKGGCYSVADGAPGSLICGELDTAPGVCRRCQDGFFRLPEPAADRHSCMLCNDTSEYEYSDSSYHTKTFEGVERCTRCAFQGEVTTLVNKPVCEVCHPDYYVLVHGSSSLCLSARDCVSSHFKKTVDGVKRCVFCGDTDRGGLDGCSTCTYASATDTVTCEGCGLYYYKKVDNGVVSCVAGDECTAPYYPKDSDDADVWDKHCLHCGDTNKNGIQDCTACTYGAGGLRCTACSGTKKPNAAGSACHECSIAHCEECSSAGVCSRCAAGYIVSASSCVEDPSACSVAGCRTCEPGDRGRCSVCLEGFYRDGAACRRCATGCAACSGADAQCTACEQGRYLLRSGSSGPGACVAACGDGHFEDSASRVCMRCTDARCKRCAAPGVCTRCQGELYLRIAPSSTDCVDAPQCYPEGFPQKSPERGNKCVPCGDSLAGIPGCVACAPEDGAVSCRRCAEGRFLDLLSRACVAQCPQNAREQVEAGAAACVCRDTYVPSDDGALCEPTRPCSQYAGCARCDSLDRCAQCADPSGSVQLDGRTCREGCPSGAAARRGRCRCVDGRIPSGNACVDQLKSGTGRLSAGAIAGISVASAAVVAAVIGCLVWFLLRRKGGSSSSRDAPLFRPVSS